MKKICTIIGARPQFVKASVLSRKLKENKQIEEVIIHTGQHYDENMSAIFFKEMNIPSPNYLLKTPQNQWEQNIKSILKKEQPNAVIVYGDTNSTLIGALASKQLNIPIVHIEAGLRSFDNTMPEEHNRIQTDHMASLLLCPTEQAIHNLKKENGQGKSIFVGDIMKDAFEYYSSRNTSNIIERLGLKAYVLATIHRAGNTDDPIKLRGIFKGLDEINKTVPVLMPIHPRTLKALQQNNITTHIQLIAPIGYFDMLCLLSNAELVVTDSGGLQKEAYWSGRFCMVARDNTEWIELIKYRQACLVGSDAQTIYNTFKEVHKKPIPPMPNLYGNHIGERIYQILCSFMNEE